ncbi:mechanosensitive ion channel family protein [Cellulomonas marina]|uniref:Small conductance mechanosensitive channel n=1 Tax=Cellulomonas marina TaxID=988821 RepID=A0A1I0V929_9CELL|nr:mechanosensitive ion channel family protein [Cellulomonas marina]GIG29212.1 mechanosensitive ion channel protein MscS [Cellulomonas marina]SFA72778.1 small conductance mechanosensitive channel [Cellulomonas marina]
MTATPSPTPDLVDAGLERGRAGLDWLLGTPLQIVIIVVAGLVAVAVLRALIHRVTDHLADGRPVWRRGVLGQISEHERAAVLLRANPLAAARRAQRSRTVGSVLRSASSLVVGTIVVVLVLDALGINIAPFIASAGIVGVALGFGAQSLVKDFLTGLFMLVEDQYGVGDVVDVGPATGTVEAVGLRVTRIRGDDGTLWYVPNGAVLRVGNKTQGWSAATVEVDVDYFVDLDEVQALLEEAARRVAADPGLGDAVEGAADVAAIERLSAEAVTVRLRVRTRPAQQWAVARRLRLEVRRLLEEAGIPLAGQRDALAAHRERTLGAALGDTAGDTAGDGAASSSADRAASSPPQG